MEPRDQKRPIDLSNYDMGPLSLRMWHGMAFDAWMRVMWGKWHLISPRRYGLVAMITVFSLGNQILKWAELLIFSRKLARVEISPDPIFVIGHWRSGTTWLHGLLMADPSHCAPDNRLCFCPETSLAGRSIVTLIMRFAMPRTRPMDNVPLKVNSTQEDEIGLCLSGAMSTVATFLFPNNEEPIPFDPKDMPARECARWRRKWIGLLKRVQFVNPGKRMVLKSPGHTLRTAEILEHFPDARFIHIVRDPYKVYLSGQKMRTDMNSVSALQDHLPSLEASEARNIMRFVEFHEQFEKDKKAIPADQIMTITYEDLRSNTAGVLRQAYNHLELGTFPETEPDMSQVLETVRPYQNNQYDLDDRTRDIVEREFADFFETYGYLPMSERPKTAS